VGSVIHFEGNRVNDPRLAPLPVCSFSTTTEWCGGVRLGADATVVNNVIFGADAPLSFGASIVQKEQAIGQGTLLSNFIDGGGRPAAAQEGVSAGVHLRNVCTTGCDNPWTGHFRSNIFRTGTAMLRAGIMEESGPEGSAPLALHPENLDNNDFVPAPQGPGTIWLYRYWNGTSFVTATEIGQINVGSGGLPDWYTANISADPALNETYHLTAGSPCIDTGHVSELAPTDRDEDARPNPATNLPDIGPDEYYP
jgi:hypothetical protein